MANLGSLPDAQTIQQGVTYWESARSSTGTRLRYLIRARQRLKLYLEDNTGDTRYN